MTSLAKIAAVVVLLSGSAVECIAAEPTPTVVEIESPLDSPHPLQGYLRRTGVTVPSAAVILLHSCNGNWRRLDERWGKRIASWGYVTLTVDSFGPRGIKSCGDKYPNDLASDAHRALDFLVQDPAIDPDRVAVLGFAEGGRMALMSVEHGMEQTSSNKFRAAVAFYPRCRSFKGNMTAPTLILIGELDDLSPATECRNMVDGRDDWGISRQKDQGFPIKLIVYPGAYHAFDAAGLTTPVRQLGHHLEYNPSATDQAISAVQEFLKAQIGGN